MLITRPQPAAAATGRRLQAMGWQPVIAPVLAILQRENRLPPANGLQAILLTSANAMAAWPGGYAALPVFAVGDASAARARSAGFTEVHSAGADAAALAALVRRRCDPHGGSLLLPCGEGQALDLAREMRAAGFRVARRVCYATRPVASLPEPAMQAMRGNNLRAALFFSPATARAFVYLLRRAAADVQVGGDHVRGVEALAISEPTAAALRPLPWRCIRVAPQPNQDDLLAMLT